jgi:predicted XRE-type DNA-binding protein
LTTTEIIVSDQSSVGDPVAEFKRALMREIRQRIRQSFRTRTDAARFLGLVTPSVSYICTLRHQRYSIEWLIEVATKLGLRVAPDVVVGDLPEHL